MRKFSISLLGSFDRERPDTKTPAPEIDTSKIVDPYVSAGHEVLTGTVEPGTWARALVAGGGDERVVHAEYVKLRVEALTLELEAHASGKRKKEAAKRSLEVMERARSDEADLIRRKAIAAIAMETGQSLEAADAMHTYGIRMSNDRFELWTEAGNRYVYDRLDDAVRYARSGRP